MDDIRQWLTGLALERFADVFEREELTPANLPELSDRDLKDLGLPLGPRKTILKAIHALRNGEMVSPMHSLDSRTLDHFVEAIPEPEGERRQLTVLFCDMVGFTELASRVDPEILQEIIQRYQDLCAVCITRYEGYVYQKQGDGVVAFFGYPLAHEDEAERAIHAGLEIIETFSRLDVPEAGRRLQVRIGIDSGLAVVSSVEVGAVGETMNLASRLQGIAEPGNIVVSERVQRLASGSFHYADMGQQTLKGVAKPTRAYRVLGKSEATSRFEAATQERVAPLVGREQELGLLLDRWALAQDGEGQVVLLTGEPGIGKSRILTALRGRLEAQGAQTVSLQCSPYYVNSTLWPNIDNFERALKFGRDEPPESRLDKLEALIVTHYGRPLTDVRFIASILSIPCDDRYGPLAMAPHKQKDETLRTLVDIAEAAARKQPTLMLYEDVHWADPSSLESLDLLIDRVRSFPLLIVLTHRPEFQSRWGVHGHVSGLNLSKLTRAQSSGMISQLAGSKALPADLVQQILAKTDGVPLFVEELTKSILESSELKEGADRYDYAGTSRTITIPATLRDSLMARLDRYMPVKEIAQIGAAIGREFSYDLIAAVAPRTKAELDDSLKRLTASGLAFCRGTPPDAVYTFKHALVQEAAYDSLLKTRRQELHRKIARVIEERFPHVKDTEPEVLARHLTEAGLDEQAIVCWQKAGEWAMQHSANVEAVSHFTTGRKLLMSLPRTPERAQQELTLLLALGVPLIATKGYAAPEVERTYARARELSEGVGGSPQFANVLWGLWVRYLTGGPIGAALEMAEQYRAIADRTQDSGHLLETCQVMGIALFYLGEFQEARPYLARGSTMYDPEQHHALIYEHGGGDTGVAIRTHEALALWALGYPDQARQRMQYGLDTAKSLARHPFTVAFGHYFYAWLHKLYREEDIVVEATNVAVQICDEHRFPFWGLASAALRSSTLIERNARAEDVGAMRRTLASYEEIGGQLYLPELHGLLGLGLAQTGRLEEAVQTVAEALKMAEQSQCRWWCAELHRLNGELTLSLPGDHAAAAEAAFQEAIAVARKQQAKSWELRAAMSLSRLWQRQGKTDDARQLLGDVHGWFTEGFDTADLRDAAALLGELKG